MEKSKDVKDRVAEIHNVSRNYVNKVLKGERNNKDIVHSYHMLQQADTKVDEVVKTLVKPN